MRLLIVAGMCALALGCTRATPDGVTSTEIERQFAAAHPDVPLDRVARFYARERDGSIRAIYLFANEGYDPIEGKAGQSTWTSPDDLPLVFDGGCSVINVNYDPVNRKLKSVYCNGVA